MNPKTTLAMGVAFFGVFITLAILKVSQVPTDKQKAEQRDKVVPALHNVDVDNVTKVSLTREKEQFEFDYEESADRWQMTKPLDVLAQTSAVRDLFFDLKNLSRRNASAKDEKVSVFEPKSATDLVQYGLDSPSSAITLVYKQKSSDKSTQSVTLQVGAATADKDGLYVKLANEKFVFVVNKSNLRSLDKKTADFRQQKLVTVSRFDSDMLRLEWPDRKVAAEKKENKWQLVEPVADRADTSKVEELIGKLGDLKADGDADYVEDDAKDLARYGLDSPALVAEIRKPGSKPKTDESKKDQSKGKEKPTIVEKVLIGKPVDGREDKVYAKLADQKYVIAVAANLVNDLAKQPNELRNHDLVEVTQGDVDFVRIHRAGGEITLAKKDRDWEIVQPKSNKAEATAVTDLVKKIDELDIKEFIDQGDGKEFGLDEPTISVALWQKGLKPDDKDAKDKAKKDEKSEAKTESPGEPKGDPIRVSFGNRDDEKNIVYVRRGDEQTIFGVSSDGLLELVDRDYLAYRSRQVLAFPPTDVAKLTIHRDGKTFSAERKKQKEEDIQESWRLIDPVSAPADSNTIDRILRGFARLNAKKIFAEGEVDLRAYGLDEPKIRATATLKALGDKEPEQHVLLVGSPADDGGTYVKLGRGDLIFSVDQVLVDDLKSELHDHTLTKFDAFRVDALTLTWGDGTKLELANKKPEGQASKTWTVPNDPTFKLDTRKVNDLLSQLAFLSSDNFAQYEGDFNESQGLTPPALMIEVKVEGEPSAKVLRVGAAAEGEKRYVATGEKSGPVALVSEDRFKDLLGGPAYLAQAEEKKPDADKPEPDKSDEKSSEVPAKNEKPDPPNSVDPAKD